MLCDKLETKMKGTVADGAIKKLFSGTMKSYVKCINIDFESARTEDFYGTSRLSLAFPLRNSPPPPSRHPTQRQEPQEPRGVVQGLHPGRDARRREPLQCRRLRIAGREEGCHLRVVPSRPSPPAQAFRVRHAARPERQGAPHWSLSSFSSQAAHSLLPQINDRHEFPLEIDVEPYLAQGADRSESHLYKLHGVLVHSGDVHGGHYFVLIKPSADGRWLRFDDDRVVPVTDREVLEDNYGGEGPIPPNGYPAQQPHAQAGAKNGQMKGTMKRFTNAYMLVYVRASRVNEILAPITTEDVPEHLRTRLERERKDAEQRKRERDEQHLYLTAKVCLFSSPFSSSSSNV